MHRLSGDEIQVLLAGVFMSVKHLEGLRNFNRAILNPITKLIAGRFFYSLVFHNGRRSGKAYTTPVVAAKKDGYIFIPLPYGTETDWLLNIQTKRECVVKIKGKHYSSIKPEMVEPSVALPAFPSMLQSAFRRAGINQFLRLQIK